RLIRLPGFVVEQIGRRRLGDEMLGRAEVAQQCPPLPLVQPRQGDDIGGTVTELREEAGDRLGGVIRADDEEPLLPCQLELSDHPHPGLDIALAEVGDRFAGGLLVLVGGGIGGGSDIDDDLVIGTDEGQRVLGIGLIGLHMVRQPHGPEFGSRAPIAQRLHGQLAQLAGQRRVLAAADAEHQALDARGQDVVDEELDPPLGLGGRVDLRSHAECVPDLILSSVFGHALTSLFSPIVVGGESPSSPQVLVQSSRCRVTVTCPPAGPQASGTILTSFGARTMTLRTPAPPRALTAFGDCRASSSRASSEMSGATSRRARTLPLTWTTQVTVSATRWSVSASGNVA